MAATTTKPVTVEELWELRHEPYRLALIDGELYRMPGAGGVHGETTTELAIRVGGFAHRGGAGRVFTETGFRLFPGRLTTLFPDLAFVRESRLPPVDERRGFLELVPDLAMEIVSPTDYPKLINDKLAAYAEARTPVVWLIDPPATSIRVIRPGHEDVILGANDILDGGDVLPGFSVRVRDLFP